MNREINQFIDNYVKEIRNNNAAIFAGAFFSKDAGYIDWKELLRETACDIGLDVSKENNLVAVAQYYCNRKNRSKINKVIFDAFPSGAEIDENHKILARLPIFTYWTTNYDSQLEMRSCLVVLVGSTTSERKWVKYEIAKAYEMKKGIVGIYIHNLENKDKEQSEKGKTLLIQYTLIKTKNFQNMLNVMILSIRQARMYMVILKKILKV